MLATVIPGFVLFLLFSPLLISFLTIRVLSKLFMIIRFKRNLSANVVFRMFGLIRNQILIQLIVFRNVTIFLTVHEILCLSVK